MMNQQKIILPNKAEFEWIHGCMNFTLELISKYLAPGAEVNPENLDTLWVKWLKAPEDKREQPNDVINAIGLSFGQLLVNNYRFEWVVVSDQYGTEIAIHRPEKEMLVFPPNMVAKRFESQQTNFLVPIYKDIVATITKKKPFWSR